MNVFGEYPQYYDLLYRDKDYDGEVRFIDGLKECHKMISLNQKLDYFLNDLLLKCSILRLL